MKIIANVEKFEIYKDNNNNPVMGARFINEAGQEIKNFKFVKFTDETETKAELIDLSSNETGN